MRLHPPLIVVGVVFFSSNPQQSNQDIGDPAVAAMRPCPDGIKCNIFLKASVDCSGIVMSVCVFVCLHVCELCFTVPAPVCISM